MSATSLIRLRKHRLVIERLRIVRQAVSLSWLGLLHLVVIHQTTGGQPDVARRTLLHSRLLGIIKRQADSLSYFGVIEVSRLDQLALDEALVLLDSAQAVSKLPEQLSPIVDRDH